MQTARIHLSPRLIAALDAARATAACYVVVHHLAQWYNITGGLGSIFRFGQEAVLIFFLLSGFVIFANERDRALNVRAYFLRRLLRIYPLLLVAMVVAALVAVANGTFTQDFSWSDLAGNLFSLEDASALKPGVIVDPFMGNSPLWSLSYEVAFYCIFPAVLWFWLRSPNATNHAIGVTSIICYFWYAWSPGHWALVGAYFLVWWCGAMVAQAYADGGVSLLRLGTPLYYLIGLCIAAATVVVKQGYTGLGVYPFLPFRHFAVALAFIVLFFSPVGKKLAGASLAVARPAAALASISYGLYVLHYPLLVRWDAAHTPTGFLLAFALMVALSIVFDRISSTELRRLVRRASPVRQAP